ncbi:MAG: T9SS type A sorting domain-containing protein [Bacteroidia bacterium]|nr:T9SS type A sorting domain-containing protein [Bacteroidia bacterium]
MKANFKSAILLVMVAVSTVYSDVPVTIVSSTPKEMVIKLGHPDYTLSQVATVRGNEYKVVLKDGSSILEKGNPDLSKYSIPVSIPENCEMTFELVSAQYDEFQNILIAPSKGTLSRSININEVPFEYNSNYTQNNFFPSSAIKTSNSYFIRNMKGQNLIVNPFSYNPVTKTLRVYKNMEIKLSFVNSMKNKSQVKFQDDKEYTAIYNDHFINHNLASAHSKINYTPINEDGDMLVICHDAFASKMTPFVEWKNLKGLRTTMVLKSTINANPTPAQIKSYITNFITTNPNLKYVLLVGDHQQIPASSTTVGPSDNEYTYLAGNDHYPDIFIGRFSAQTSTDVEVQVNKVINYEKYPQLNGNFYNIGACIASDEGPGDNNELDYQHQQVIKAKLQAFTYGTVGEFYEGSQGGGDAPGDPTPLDLQNFINAGGAGIINYTGHGSDFSFATTGFSTSNIPNLTNTNKLPFIVSVACVNGNFTTNNACFAEAWLRAGTPAAPKGAIATVMSTINQYWNEPMCGQDHMMDVLATNTVSIKRTFAGMAMNGCMHMNDQYGVSGEDMTDTWTVFGDPSLRLTTASVTPMTVTHPASVNLGTANVNVNCNENGALVCFNVLGNILTTAKVNAGVASMNFAPLTAMDTIFVTATAFNKTPYFGKIIVNGTTTGINEQVNNNGLRLFPNPAVNSVNVKLPSYNGNYSIEILNVIGQVVHSTPAKFTVNGIQESVDLKDFAQGTYILRLKTDSELKQIKFVKQ